jgi:hypothetical protein
MVINVYERSFSYHDAYDTNSCNLRYKDAYTSCYKCHAKCKRCTKKSYTYATKELLVRVLYPATSIGDTRQRVDTRASPDLELEGMREDTRHKIYTGSGSQSSYPTSCLL